jgi:hypothetical protein
MWHQHPRLVDLSLSLLIPTAVGTEIVATVWNIVATHVMAVAHAVLAENAIKRIGYSRVLNPDQGIAVNC